MRIVVDPSSFEHKSSALTGVIAVSYRDGWFPEANWNDFPAVLLNWWLDEIQTGREEATLRFMDGPHRVELHSGGVSPGGEWTWSGRFMIRGDALPALGTDEVVECSSLRQSLRDIGQSVVALCKERGWIDEEIERLARKCA